MKNQCNMDKDVELELIRPAIVSLFELIAIRRMEIHQVSSVVALDVTGQRMIVVDEDLILDTGEFSLQLSAVQSICALKRKYNPSVQLSIETDNGYDVYIELEEEQPDDVWNLLGLLDSGSAPAAKPDATIPRKCKCCKEREEIIRNATDSHPIALILDELCKDGEILNMGHGGVRCSTDVVLQPIHAHFAKGVAHIKGEKGKFLSFKISSIYGVHLKLDKIDGDDHSSMDLFNSFGQKFLRISAPGAKRIDKWNEVLSSMELT